MTKPQCVAPFLVALTLVACSASRPAAEGRDAGTVASDGGLLIPFSAPPASPVNNSIVVTISGGSGATAGFAFPPGGSAETYFVDGWNLEVSHFLAVVGAVTLSESPNLKPNDPRATGPAVAQARGPWAVDLARPGPVDAKEMNGKAVSLFRLDHQNLKAGTQPFDASATYALSYELIRAQPGAYDVNLDDAGRQRYTAMVEKGWSVLLEGTATWKGNSGATACRTSDSTYDFGRFPKTVHFRIGFGAPVAFKNCINPELQPADSRGVQTQVGAETVAQLTLYPAHAFREALDEESALRFDAIGARASALSGPGPQSVDLTEATVEGLDLEAPTDAQGNAIPWRTCGPVQSAEHSQGFLSYDPTGAPVDPSGGVAGLKDLYDYMTYNLSAFGYLNNRGLCQPLRQYPSPK